MVVGFQQKFSSILLAKSEDGKGDVRELRRQEKIKNGPGKYSEILGDMKGLLEADDY